MPSAQILFTDNTSSGPPAGYALVKDPVVAAIPLGATEFQNNTLIGASSLSVSYGAYTWYVGVNYTFVSGTGTLTFIDTIVDDNVPIEITPYFT